MHQQGNNQNQIIYTDQYGVPINPKPNIINNPAYQIKYTLPYNPKNQNPDVLKKPLNNNNQNVAYVNKNPNKLRSKQNSQIFSGHSVEETYMTDSITGEKLVLQTVYYKKGNTNNATNQNNKIKIYQNKEYTKAPQEFNKIHFQNNNTYLPEIQINNTTANTFQDITSSIEPNIANMQRKLKSSQIVYQEQRSPIIENYNINPTIVSPHGQGYKIHNDIDELDPRKSASLLTVSTLANIPYNKYSSAEFSKEPFFNIEGYGFNSYNGKVKKFNEDRIKVIVNYQIKKYMNCKLNISYFSIFDGHSGNKCCDFLKENLDGYLFNSSFFPSDIPRAIRESFKKAEDNFRGMVYDPKSNILLDKSGSCALVMLIINNYLFAINLGDSRALYSYDSGKYLLQITRDHKPNDEIEKKRIEKAGGKVFYANTITRNGREIELKEEQFGKGFTFPYRIFPGKIAVSLLYNNLGCKNYWRLLCKSPSPGRIHRRTYI